MERKVFEHINEEIYYEKLDNGLDVYIVPKPGFNKYYATFTTKYGSIDNKFIPIGEEEMITVPDGIAHFLEHKMFESEEGDVFNDFSKYGANANAFTSFNRTAYLFSCTDFFKENLEILLNFVQEPYFTDENVEKEKGIIEQEIKMYDDSPDWQLFSGVLDNMYKDHTIKIDIAGTVESIYKINKELLYQCYYTFYHPSNMLLCIVGDVDVNQTLDFIKKNQDDKDFKEMKELERNYIFEDNNVDVKDNAKKMAVQVPKVIIAVKNGEANLLGKEAIKRELAVGVLLDFIFDGSSEFRETLIKEKLINATFSYELSFEYSFGHVLIGGDTKEPEKFISRIKDKLLDLGKMDLNEEEFKRIKNKSIGGFLSSLNSPEFIANQFTRYKFNDVNLFDALDILEEITLEDVEKVKDIFVEDAISVMKIMPE